MVLTGCEYGIMSTGAMLVMHQCNVAEAANFGPLGEGLMLVGFYHANLSICVGA